ncbi:MAG: hypothetical protein AB1801_26555 [Chloroflexota bacterium]
MRLSPAERQILRALIEGCTLKAHRYLDGQKVYQLHPLDGPPTPIDKAVVDSLKRRQLIDSNKKFPAATYLLTGPGQELAVALARPKTIPLSAKNYTR